MIFSVPYLFRFLSSFGGSYDPKYSVCPLGNDVTAIGDSSFSRCGHDVSVRPSVDTLMMNWNQSVGKGGMRVETAPTTDKQGETIICFWIVAESILL